MFTRERIGEIIRQLSQLRYPMVQPVTEWIVLHAASRPFPTDGSLQWMGLADRTVAVKKDRYQGIRISYDLVGFIPVEELLKQETA